VYSSTQPPVEINAAVRLPLPVLDYRGSLALYARTEAEVHRLIASGGYDALRTKTRIRALRAKRTTKIESSKVIRGMGRIRQPGFADPHRRETMTNPRGVWTMPRIHDGDRDIFRRVIDEQLVIVGEEAA
jgi:hypothetical protein